MVVEEKLDAIKTCVSVLYFFKCAWIMVVLAEPCSPVKRTERPCLEKKKKIWSNNNIWEMKKVVLGG